MPDQDSEFKLKSSENDKSILYTPTRRHLLQALGVGAGLTAFSGLGQAQEPVDSGTTTVFDDNEQNTLRIVGGGNYSSYEFSVIGTIDEEASRGLTGEDSIAADGMSAAGAVRGGRDTYVFEGELENVVIAGDFAH